MKIRGEHRLERTLGPDVQVLNFGVEAYGVDQAYLRYLRDVRPWRPQVVILGLIDHDLLRSMAVYFFLSFPGWDYPFAKPRFAAERGDLRLAERPAALARGDRRSPRRSGSCHSSSTTRAIARRSGSGVRSITPTSIASPSRSIVISWSRAGRPRRRCSS